MCGATTGDPRGRVLACGGPSGVDAAVWLQRAEQAPGIRLVPLTRPVLLQSTRLSGATHSDPADRMLIALAQLDNIPLVTCDRLILEYASSHGGTPVVDARP